MASSSRAKSPKQVKTSPDQRRLRAQQIIFSILALIIILSMVVSLFINL